MWVTYNKLRPVPINKCHFHAVFFFFFFFLLLRKLHILKFQQIAETVFGRASFKGVLVVEVF